MAHNVAATHVLRSRRRKARQFTTLDDAEFPVANTDVAAEVNEAQVLQRLYALIECLAPRVSAAYMDIARAISRAARRFVKA